MNVHEVKSIETKSILSRLKSKDNYWGIAYNMNLYRGCQHGCIYCDTRSSCYGVGDISHISVKKNALELLYHELGTKRGKATIGTLYTSSCYKQFPNNYLYFSNVTE